MNEVARSARISECGTFRYWLSRVWDESKRPMVSCGLNPSTADAEVDDPTIRKEVGFAKLAGCGALYKINLYAYRATDWRKVRDRAKVGADLLGPEFDAEFDKCMRLARDSGGLVVAAWGGHVRSIPGAVERTEAVVARLRDRCGKPGYVYSLGRTTSGDPRHPLMLSYKTNMERM